MCGGGVCARVYYPLPLEPPSHPQLPSHTSSSSQSIELSSLRFPAGSHQLAVSHRVAQMSQSSSLNPSHPPLPLRPHVGSLHPCPIALQSGASFCEENVCLGALLLSLEGVMANQ